MAVSLTFPYSCTKNVAIATVMTYFVRSFKELSSDTSPNSLSKIEVEIELFECFTFDFACDLGIY